MSSRKTDRGTQTKQDLVTSKQTKLQLIPAIRSKEETVEAQFERIVNMASSGKPLRDCVERFKQEKLYLDLSLIASIQDALTSGGLELNKILPFENESKIARLSTTKMGAELAVEIMKNYQRV